MPELTQKERFQRRLESMKKARQGFESDAKEIAAYTQPAKSRFLSSAVNGGRQSNRRLNNSHGIYAFRTLQNGMTSGMTSESRPWFTIKPMREEWEDDYEIKGYCAVVERLMYSFIASTNFYGAVKTGYGELGGFGTEACIALPDDDEGMVCHQLTFGEYWLGLGKNLQPDSLYRMCPMTVKNAVDTFGYAQMDHAIQRAYDNSDYDMVVEFYHAIEPNQFYEPGKMGWQGKPWASVYWNPKDSSKERFIQRQGFDEQPFWAPRWDVTSSDVWGDGPGHDALPDLRELQLQTKRKAEATDLHVWPEMIVSSRVKLKRMPKNVVSVAGQDVDASRMVNVPYQVPYQAIGMVREDITDLKQSINEACFADLFMAITNMQGVQPRNIEEIASRNEEKLTQLGPVIQRVNNEKLEVAIERVFGIMQRGGLLPPAPDKMREAPDLRIEFVSILTQMQRMVGLGQLERGMSFAGGILPIFPELRHRLDGHEILEEYWDRAGAPPKGLRSREDAEADAEEEAQNQQAAMLAEAAGKAAPAGKVAVDAARLMAETPQSGAPPVEEMLPLVPR
jgi:hypothetical protein